MPRALPAHLFRAQNLHHRFIGQQRATFDRTAIDVPEDRLNCAIVRSARSGHPPDQDN